MIDAKNHARRLRTPFGGAYDYIAAFRRQASFCVEMTKNLKSGVDTGEFGSKALMEALQTMGGDVTAVRREVEGRLGSDAVVPFEREGLRSAARAFEALGSSVETIAADAYVYCLEGVPLGGAPMLSLLVYAASELKSAAAELGGLPASLGHVNSSLSKVKTYVRECTATFRELAHGLYENRDLDAEERRLAHAVLADMHDAMISLGTCARRVEALLL